MPQAALVLQDVGFAYPGREVLRRVTLAVPKSCVTVVLGPNGSGKTTLMRLAAGLVRPQRGRVLLQDDEDAHVAVRQGRIGYIPQQLGLVASRTAVENAAAGALRAGSALASLLGIVPSDVQDRALAALDQVHLREKAHVRVRSLSGGERQRVAIARTLVQRPDVLVADELIASLDVLQAQGVMQILREQKRRGAAILLSLHQIDIALSNADQVAFLVRGSITNPRSPDGMSVEEARWALTA